MGWRPMRAPTLERAREEEIAARRPAKISAQSRSTRIRFGRDVFRPRRPRNPRTQGELTGRGAWRRDAMRFPIVKGLIERRALVNFRVAPDVLQRQLPAPFRVQAVNGW